jgi:hypothetical protein
LPDWLAQQPFRKSLTKNVSPASQVLLVKLFFSKEREDKNA